MAKMVKFTNPHWAAGMVIMRQGENGNLVFWE